MTNKKPKETPVEKPELTPEMAAYLVMKLDGPVSTDSHQDRNNFSAAVNKLVAIANWIEPE